MRTLGHGGCNWCFRTIPVGVTVTYADKRFCSFGCRGAWINDMMMLTNTSGNHYVGDNPSPDTYLTRTRSRPPDEG